MAITFINKGTWAAGTTSISPGIPASMQAGDFMLLQVHTCNQAVTTPSGWTAVTNSPVSTGTANTAGGTRISMYYRWWQSGDAAPTVAVTSGTVTNGIITGYRGVDATTPFDATPVATTLATASTTLTMTGITTATANALIHWGVARDQDAASTTAVTAYTNANLTGITETHDQVVSTGVGGGIWTGRGFNATAGATGNTTITQTSSIAVGLTIALRPAPNSYTLTCQGGAYTLTGGSAVLSKVNPLRPVLISSTTLALGTSATPGAQSVTVPSDAQLVVVQATSYTSGGITLSLASSFAGTFTTTTAGDGGDKCHIAYALVSSTGSQTITPTWSAAVTDGPLFFVSFIKNINTSDFLRQALAYNINTQGSTTSTTISSSTNDLVLAMEREGLTTTIPAVMSGFTSASTQGVNNIGGRNQTADAPGASTTTLQSSGTEFPGFSAISIKPNVGGAYTLTAQGGSYSLTGQQAALQKSKVIVASGGSYSLTGQNANLVKGRVFTAQGGSYTYTGQSVNLLRSKKITATGGAYSLTGQQAILSRSKYLIAQGGTYNLAGGSATITWTAGATAYTLICQGGSYALLGASAGISRNRNLTANGGSYTYTGSSATIKRNRSLQASGGTYTYTGSSATLLKSKTIQASGGTYTITGGSAVILKSKVLVGSGGSYIYSGQNANLKKSRLLVASGGSYALTGSSAVITWTTVGGAVYPPVGSVLLGVTYGPTGTEYTGTLDIGKKFRIDIATGNIVMIIDSNKVMSL